MSSNGQECRPLVEPIGPRVVARQIVSDEFSGRGIILPGVAASEVVRGVVLEIGTNVNASDKVCPVDVGDHIVYALMPVRSVMVAGESYDIVPWDAIVGRVRRGDVELLQRQAAAERGG